MENPANWFDFKAKMESYLMKIQGANKVLLHYIIRDDTTVTALCAIASDWGTFLWTRA